MRCQQLQLQEIFNRAILLHRAKSQPAAYVVGVSSDELSTQRQRPQTQMIAVHAVETKKRPGVQSSGLTGRHSFFFHHQRRRVLPDGIVRRRLLNIDIGPAGTLVESLHREAMGMYKNSNGRCPFTNAVRDALLTGRRRRRCLTVKRPRTKDPLLCLPQRPSCIYTTLSKPL